MAAMTAADNAMQLSSLLMARCSFFPSQVGFKDAWTVFLPLRRAQPQPDVNKADAIAAKRLARRDRPRAG
jgi:hypothetical protein